jgi:KTSC domain
MKHVPVISSSLQSVGYDYASQTLEIAFQNGSVYQYFGVPPAVHEELITASSHGAYFNAFIRDRYRYRRL